MPDDKRTTSKQLVPIANAATAFTKTEARKFTDSIRADVEALWMKVQEAHERKAWAALGYDSFADYMDEEFGYGRAHAYRILDAASVIRELTPELEFPTRESPIGDRDDEWIESRRRQEMDFVLSDFPRVANVPLPTRLAQTNELIRLKYEGRGVLVETWEQVIARYGPNPTGKQVREVVQERRKEVRETLHPETALPYRLRELNDRLLSVRDEVAELSEALDDEAWSPEDGLLTEAPREFLDRWRVETKNAQDALAHALRRLTAAS